MKIPSYKASIIAGAVITPIFAIITEAIAKNYGHVSYIDISLFIWGLVGFILPLALATADFNYFKREYGSYREIFNAHWSKKDFKEFFVPAWKRTCVWFCSCACSIIVLKIFKIWV